MAAHTHTPTPDIEFFSFDITYQTIEIEFCKLFKYLVPFKEKKTYDHRKNWRYSFAILFKLINNSSNLTLA